MGRAATEIVNLACTAIFALELALKLIGLSYKEFKSDWYNLFDIVVVSISVLSMIFDISRVDFDAGGITALRALRILRICKLARNWTSLQVSTRDRERILDSKIDLSLVEPRT